MNKLSSQMKLNSMLILGFASGVICSNIKNVSEYNCGITGNGKILPPKSVYFNCPFSNRERTLEFSTLPQKDNGFLSKTINNEKYSFSYEINYTIDYSVNPTRFYGFKRNNMNTIYCLIERILYNNDKLLTKEEIKNELSKRGVNVTTLNLLITK